MRPQKYYTKSNWDLWAYSILSILLLIYAIQIKLTCEELGCLAFFLPVIGIMGLSVIEFIINIIAYSKKYHFNLGRKIVFVISGLICIYSILGPILSSLVY